MPDVLPSFPVDDVTLAALEHALGGALSCEDGEPRLVGAEFSVSTLLDFLSGYDPSQIVPCVDDDGFVIPDFVEYTGGPIYHVHDVIRALIAEVRRLR